MKPDISQQELLSWRYRGASAMDRFWGKVQMENPHGCWHWIGSRNRFGYGTLTIRQEGYLAHRISWIATRGDIQNDLRVLHKCDVPYCVNPIHLYLGTYLDNNLDCVRKGRHKTIRGSDVAISKLSEEEVKEIKRLYDSKENHNKTDLARKFKVSDTMIRNIVWRRWWKHIEPKSCQF